MECVSNLAVGNCDVVIYQVLDLRGTPVLWVKEFAGWTEVWGLLTVFLFSDIKRKGGMG